MRKYRLGHLDTFFALSIYIYKLFITINKKEKWESGPKCLKPSNCKGFSRDTFKIKVGQNPLKSGPKLLFRPSNSKQDYSSPQISGPKPVFVFQKCPKSEQKEKPLLGSLFVFSSFYHSTY